ncbi:PQQ-dependent catabolism-associated CXXCW motif protein [Azospirillum sp. RWY-5-1]|uniref:PQQ-dependent catabolism-associated CXXCW motif protein n=1 Tax=Azospirillum oleiclasticum TaxID=2735135 RepID=A0ABX2T9T0_9PROT|nr:PQQ-dependent catabolism-associated CXXCW motif protein [Azospirillum oleiclasticum]NYZ12748.1 PQQ-dependent catabolism-associated CXXCW motif protein [Azospirillum oleiclasticum]NYZ19908.1 PQQ-dependent catabolism-associated CXXCW motif protein [Azospirillum oleiclasticum]
MPRPTAAALCAALLLFTPPVLAGGVPEPEGYRLSDYRAPTPDGLAGATTLDTDGVRALLERGDAIPINVLKLERSTLPGAPWLLPAPRPQIPGSLWLPNVGTGAPDAGTAAWFATVLHRMTGGNVGRALLFYCLADCWMSWNAAKRALSLGYRNVHWYPAGMDGWIEAGLPTEEVPPLLPGVP